MDGSKLDLFRVVWLIRCATPEVIIYVVSDVNPDDQSHAPHNLHDSTSVAEKISTKLIPCKLPDISLASGGAKDQARHVSGYPRKRRPACTKNKSRFGL